MSVGGSEDRGCGSVVEHLFQMYKVLRTTPKSSEGIKYSRKTTISVVFIIPGPEGLKGLGFKDLAEGRLFSSGLIEGFLPAILLNNLAIYKENRDSELAKAGSPGL